MQTSKPNITHNDNKVNTNINTKNEYEDKRRPVMTNPVDDP